MAKNFNESLGKSIFHDDLKLAEVVWVLLKMERKIKITIGQ